VGHLLSVTKKPGMPTEGAFPWSVPAVRAFERLELSPGVTFFVGENGSGKSTLLEAIALAAEIPGLAPTPPEADVTLAKQLELARYLRLAWTARSRRGLYLRAESYYLALHAQARNEARVLRERVQAENPAWMPDRVPLPGEAVHVDELSAEPYFAAMDARSHGESFLGTLERKVSGPGLYLLDEPESPLSPKRQITLLKHLRAAVRGGSQIVIATHSPILLALPGAKIVSFDTVPPSVVAYDDLEHVRVVRDFLRDPAAALDE
jgi:predicted ATPase